MRKKLERTLSLAGLALVPTLALSRTMPAEDPTVIECGSTGPWVTIPKAEAPYEDDSSYDIGLFPTFEEAEASLDDEATAEGWLAIVDRFTGQYHCDLCPPPDTDHCTRRVGFGDNELGVQGGVTSEGDEFRAVVIVVEACDARVHCWACDLQH